jgi:mRNA interferase RelE/StbE
LAYNIQYKRSVAKDLARLDKAAARQLLAKIEKELATRPGRFPALVGPFAGLRKMRMGDYRVIFTLLDKEVLVLRIGNRRDVYK